MSLIWPGVTSGCGLIWGWSDKNFPAKRVIFCGRTSEIRKSDICHQSGRINVWWFDGGSSLCIFPTCLGTFLPNWEQGDKSCNVWSDSGGSFLRSAKIFSSPKGIKASTWRAAPPISRNNGQRSPGSRTNLLVVRSNKGAAWSHLWWCLFDSSNKF